MTPQEQALAPYHETGQQIALVSVPVTLSEIAHVVEGIVKAVADGDAALLATFAKLRALETIAKDAQEALRPQVMAAVPPKGTYELATFEVRSGGMKWDFSKCTDVVLQDMYAALEEAKKLVFNRERYLIALTQNGGLDLEGEIVDIVLPSSTPRTDSLIVKLQD